MKTFRETFNGDFKRTFKGSLNGTFKRILWTLFKEIFIRLYGKFLREFLRDLGVGILFKNAKVIIINKFKNEPNREILHSSKINSKI